MDASIRTCEFFAAPPWRTALSYRVSVPWPRPSTDDGRGHEHLLGFGYDQALDAGLLGLAVALAAVVTAPLS
jgi:hypothetical protein